jgi:dTDP-glucose 4,6-dehydratase
MSRRYLVTGGAGFIGSHFIRHVLSIEPDARVTNLDAMLVGAVQATVDELDEDPRHSFVYGDVRDAALLEDIVPGHDVVVHFAAESHVDRSIADPSPFADGNVVGTARMLFAAMHHRVARFLLVSTDEVYGSIGEGAADESAPLRPSSPYSASKAGADLMAHAYGVTYGLDVVVTRCTNNYGPYQYPEKLIPLFVTNLLRGKRVPLYADGANVRDWLHVADHCRALHLIVDSGTAGEVYNVASGSERSNLEVTMALLDLLGLDDSMIQHVDDRPGHDRRYALDAAKTRALGWEPSVSFSDGLAATVDWYRARREWWGPLVGEA